MFNKERFLAEWNGLLDQMRDTQAKKSHDYAGTADPLSNLRFCEQAGIPAWVGVAGVRLGDKYSRLQNFIKQGELKVKDESVEDTLMDNAVYSLLAIILYRERKEMLAAKNNEVNGQ